MPLTLRETIAIVVPLPSALLSESPSLACSSYYDSYSLSPLANMTWLQPSTLPLPVPLLVKKHYLKVVLLFILPLLSKIRYREIQFQFLIKYTFSS